MLCKLSFDTDIKSSQCDHTGRLGLAQCFDVFMDLATRHADELGIGRRRLNAEGLAWVVTKTIVKVSRMPEMSEIVTLSTWPAHPSKVHCERFYTITTGNELLACGKTEWINMDLSTGRLSPPGKLFTPDTEFCEDVPVPESFDRITGQFPEEAVYTHKVRTTDIDVNGHVNNTKYIYALLDSFTTKELDEKPIKAAEVLYKAQAREGDVLFFYERPAWEGITDWRIAAGSQTAVFARLWR